MPGTYQAEQDITASTPGVVTIRAANGRGSVTTGSISISTSNVVVDGFQTANNDPNGNSSGKYGLTIIAVTGASTSNVTVQNTNTHGLFIQQTSNVTFRNVDAGWDHTCNQVQNGGDGGEDGVVINSPSPAAPTTHLTFDNVTIHDVDRWQGGVQSNGLCSNGQHTDGMQIYAATYLTIENSHFYNDATSDIMARPCCSGGEILDHWSFVNDEFSPILEGGSANEVTVGAGDNCGGSDNFAFENVTIDGSIRFGCSGGPGTVTNSIIKQGGYDCNGQNATYAYDVFEGAASTCTSTPHAKSCTPTWADASHANGNYDTTSTDTCARDAADKAAGNYPTTDIHGVSRPLGAGPDAGANESG